METRILFCVICGDHCTREEMLMVPGKEGTFIEVCEGCHKGLWRYFDTLNVDIEKEEK